MKIIIFIILLIILSIILCNIDKNINDNFINYQMSEIGENKKDIKIHGKNINIETKNSTLNVLSIFGWFCSRSTLSRH